MKKLFKLMLVMVVLLVVAIGVVVVMIDQIAKGGIERGATYALGVDTTVDSADVGLTTGDFDMAGLRVSNPPGYTSDHFLRLGEGGMGVSLGTLMEEIVEVPRLILSDIDVNLEKQQGKANYQAILENLGRFESQDKSSKEGKRFIIRELVIANVQVHVNLLPVGGDLTKVNVRVPEIRLNDIGTDGDQGVLIAQLTDILVKAILRAAAEQGGGLIPTDILGDLSSSLAKLKDLESMGVEFTSQTLEQVGETVKKAQEAVGQVGETVEETRKQVEEGAGKVIEGVGNLFKKKDDGGE